MERCGSTASPRCPLQSRHRKKYVPPVLRAVLVRKTKIMAGGLARERPASTFMDEGNHNSLCRRPDTLIAMQIRSFPLRSRLIEKTSPPCPKRLVPSWSARPSLWQEALRRTNNSLCAPLFLCFSVVNNLIILHSVNNRRHSGRDDLGRARLRSSRKSRRRRFPMCTSTV